MKNLTLPDNGIFVFGSNLQGRHGKGAAKVALEKYGARYGVGYGLQGRSYAIPTKDARLNSLPLEIIAQHVTAFLEFARTMPASFFVVTKIGCGLAGYTPEQIAPMFRGAPANVKLPWDFVRILHRA